MPNDGSLRFTGRFVTDAGGGSWNPESVFVFEPVVEEDPQGEWIFRQHIWGDNRPETEPIFTPDQFLQWCVKVLELSADEVLAPHASIPIQVVKGRRALGAVAKAQQQTLTDFGANEYSPMFGPALPESQRGRFSRPSDKSAVVLRLGAVAVSREKDFIALNVSRLSLDLAAEIALYFLRDLEAKALQEGRYHVPFLHSRPIEDWEGTALKPGVSREWVPSSHNSHEHSHEQGNPMTQTGTRTTTNGIPDLGIPVAPVADLPDLTPSPALVLAQLIELGKTITGAKERTPGGLPVAYDGLLVGIAAFLPVAAEAMRRAGVKTQPGNSFVAGWTQAATADLEARKRAALAELREYYQTREGQVRAAQRALAEAESQHTRERADWEKLLAEEQERASTTLQEADRRRKELDRLDKLLDLIRAVLPHIFTTAPALQLGLSAHGLTPADIFPNGNPVSGTPAAPPPVEPPPPPPASVTAKPPAPAAPATPAKSLGGWRPHARGATNGGSR